MFVNVNDILQVGATCRRSVFFSHNKTVSACLSAVKTIFAAAAVSAEV
jgi:hypothetical protein